MTFFDWNRDGKKDGFDDFLEYTIFKECFEDKDDNEDPIDFDDDFEEYDEFFGTQNTNRKKDGI